MENLKIVKELGKGGNSEAYLAEYGVSKKRVTLKRCREIDGQISIHVKKNLENEAKILAGLDHKAIPKLIEKSENMIVLEHMLGDTMERALLNKGPLGEKEALHIAKELAGILRYLHSQNEPVIYRDLKPANIIISEQGKVSLIDFGAARYYKPYEQADTVNLGTVGFAAPEQFGSLGQTDPRTDIYCFGMTLLQMVSGVNAQDPDAVARYKKRGIKGISPEFMNIIRKCTCPDREDRFKSVKEIMIALDNYPKKVMGRRLRRAFKVTVAALLISVLLTWAVTYGERVEDIVIADADDRMPQVKLRIYYARTRIEEYLRDSGLIEIINMPEDVLRDKAEAGTKKGIIGQGK